MSDEPPTTSFASFRVRTHIEGFSVLCHDCATPWWWPRRRDAPLWWPLTRLIPAGRRPRPPQPVSLAWVRVDNGDLGAAALQVITKQSMHVSSHRTHRIEVRESGTVTFDTDRIR